MTHIVIRQIAPLEDVLMTARWFLSTSAALFGAPRLDGAGPDGSARDRRRRAALTVVQDGAKHTVGVGLRAFFTPSTADRGSVMAASTIITEPVVIFFVLVPRHLAQGMIAGAVKG